MILIWFDGNGTGDIETTTRGPDGSVRCAQGVVGVAVPLNSALCL